MISRKDPARSLLNSLGLGLEILVIVSVIGINFLDFNRGSDEVQVSVLADTGTIPGEAMMPLQSPTGLPLVTEESDAPVSIFSPGSACAAIWNIQPPSTVPEWLLTPMEESGLNTKVRYYFLAGEMIARGYVQAGDCPDGGLTSHGTASTCGMDKAYDQVITWQNQFDGEILEAALTNQVPAQVLKRLFAQETQFWPPTSLAPSSYGLGNVTSPGVEPLFLWDEAIYQKTCLEVYAHGCEKPYHAQSLANQQVLRGFFISTYLHAYCPDCPLGMDLEKVSGSIDYFARLIVANCNQVDLILKNHGFTTQGLSYEDAWRLTLSSYAVGAGCLSQALEAFTPGSEFSWSEFTGHLAPDCSVDLYLSRVTGNQ